MVEVLTKYLKDVFDHDPRKRPRVHAYRGGYLPQERRATERLLRAGEVDCVVSTSALELGVDIGALDVCILNGWPGSVAATWQRLGRAGRRQQAALGVLVAGSEPLDQYIIRHPEYFLGASPEHARIAPDQLLILLDHVRCAAFELPFADGERYGDVDPAPLLGFLAEQGLLHHDHGQWHWVADSYPANAVNLRSVADGNFVVVDRTDGAQTIIAEVDYSSAAGTLYEGAIYMVQSRPWQVEQLDWTGRKAYVTRTHVDYYTDAIDYQKLKILAAFEQASGAGVASAHGEVHLVRRVTGYKKIRYYTHENIGYGPVNLPDHEMHTTAVWWTLESKVLERAFRDRWQALDGFLGAAWALHTVAVLLAMAEPRDLGRAVGSGAGDWHATVGPGGRGELRDGADAALDPDGLRRFEPTVFLYDNHPGGSGFSESLHARRARIVTDAQALVAHCGCTAGCPACVGPVLAGDETGERGNPKAAATVVLALMAAQAGAADASTAVAPAATLDVHGHA
jgi:DEAD/DEAH box helicase domain-containing protein